MTQLDIVCDLNRRLRERCEAAEARIAALEAHRSGGGIAFAGMTPSDHIYNEMRKQWARAISARQHSARWKKLAKVLRSRERRWMKQAHEIMRVSEEVTSEREPELRRGDYARMKFWREKAEEAERERDELKAKLAKHEQSYREGAADMWKRAIDAVKSTCLDTECHAPCNVQAMCPTPPVLLVGGGGGVLGRPDNLTINGEKIISDGKIVERKKNER